MDWFAVSPTATDSPREVRDEIKRRRSQQARPTNEEASSKNRDKCLIGRLVFHLSRRIRLTKGGRRLDKKKKKPITDPA
jgi:hypothetical protein